MHFTLRKAAAAVCLLLAASTAQAEAPLQNAVITASYNAGGMLSAADDYAGGNVSGLDPYNIYAEFFTTDFLFGFDFASDGHLTIYNNTPVPAGTYNASFDFGSSLGAAIKGFSVTDTGITGGTPVLSIINDHTIAIDLSGVEWNGEFSTLQTSIILQAVPEPASAWLLMAGLAGLGLYARRRS